MKQGIYTRICCGRDDKLHHFHMDSSDKVVHDTCKGIVSVIHIIHSIQSLVFTFHSDDAAENIANIIMAIKKSISAFQNFFILTFSILFVI